MRDLYELLTNKNIIKGLNSLKHVLNGLNGVTLHAYKSWYCLYASNPMGAQAFWAVGRSSKSHKEKLLFSIYIADIAAFTKLLNIDKDVSLSFNSNNSEIQFKGKSNDMEATMPVLASEAFAKLPEIVVDTNTTKIFHALKKYANVLDLKAIVVDKNQPFTVLHLYCNNKLLRAINGDALHASFVRVNGDFGETQQFSIPAYYLSVLYYEADNTNVSVRRKSLIVHRRMDDCELICTLPFVANPVVTYSRYYKLMTDFVQAKHETVIVDAQKLKDFIDKVPAAKNVVFMPQGNNGLQIATHGAKTGQAKASMYLRGSEHTLTAPAAVGSNTLEALINRVETERVKISFSATLTALEEIGAKRSCLLICTRVAYQQS